MSAQCKHKLVRYECWECRDEWKEPKPMSIDVTSNNDALAAEVAALRHDIERHVQIAAEQAQDIERLRRVVNAAIRLREATRIVGDTKTECKEPGCICHAACDFDAAIAAITVDHKP